jgi:hypothetical protein
MDAHRYMRTRLGVTVTGGGRKPPCLAGNITPPDRLLFPD